MNKVHRFLLIGFIAFLAFNYVDAGYEVNITSNSALDATSVEPLKQNGTFNANLGLINNGNEKTFGLKKSNSSNHVVLEEAEDDTGLDVRSSESTVDHNAGLKNAGDHASEKQDDEKAKAVGMLGLESGHEVASSTGEKDSIRGEHCDSSPYSCNIEDESLLACLRVPGNESPDLSLLVQNKGKHHISVSISASKYVELETRQIDLKEMENMKIKVSFKNSGSDNFIIVEAGDGKCKLDFSNLIEHNADNEADHVSHFKYPSLSSSATLMFLVALLLCASVWPCINYYKKHVSKMGSGKYRKLDMELPISGGVKLEVAVSDGWDKSWDDNWDDEEAPKTPAVPVTPSRPSKVVVASRRSNKDSWKD
ncbi:unnamed protein product [Cuscuta epithymum]|uniref:DUF7356 domain-containing protein n=1 Tax=Cuscuta epithymum TaxID=186058 RepID=A0AAV0D0B8_9ASTE|nr:unnamed protein product [Cuscuta epithymum]